MSLEDFPLLGNERIDNIIIERVSLKVYHRGGANLWDQGQNCDFNFGENYNYHKEGDSYLEFDITLSREDNANLTDISAIRMTNNAFAHVFEETRLSTTSGGDLEHNNFVGQTSTIMIALTSKDGDLLSQFVNINEGNGSADFDYTFSKKSNLTITF